MAEQQVVTTEQPALKVPTTLKSLVEALIFAADEPLTVRQLKAIYERQGDSGEERNLEQSDIQQIIQTLNDEYKTADRPYRIIAVAGGFQFATLKEYAEWLGRLHREQSRRKLSQSALETLAMVAYKQPMSKPEIEAIRGVNCDYVLKTLLEKELVTIVGRAETVGRPLLYGTTREFLKHFGLNEITDLPRPREIEEILGESQFETERRMLEAQAGAEQMKREEEDFKSRLPHIPKKKPELSEDVKIIPKGRTKKLHVKPKQEDSGQEALELPGEKPAEPIEATTEPDGESLEVVPAEDQPTPSGTVEAPLEVNAETESQGQFLENGIHPELSGDEPAGQRVEWSPADARDELPLANQQQSDDVTQERRPHHEPPPNEPEVTQPRRTRWTGWKETIRTFIRKLFG